MTLFLGLMLVLGMMILIFLGPEWAVDLRQERQGLKKSRQQR